MGEYNVTVGDIRDRFEEFLRSVEGNVSAEVIASAWNKIAEEYKWTDRLQSSEAVQ